VEAILPVEPIVYGKRTFTLRGGYLVLTTLCWVRRHLVHRLSRFSWPSIIIKNQRLFDVFYH